MLSCSNSETIKDGCVCTHPQARDKPTQAFPVSHLSSSFLSPFIISAYSDQTLNVFLAAGSFLQGRLLFELPLCCVAVWASLLCVDWLSRVFLPILISHFHPLSSELYQDILCCQYSACVHSPRSSPGWITYSPREQGEASRRILWKFCLPGTLQFHSHRLHHCSDITFQVISFCFIWGFLFVCCTI